MPPFKRKIRATARKTGWKVGSQRKPGKWVIPISRSLVRQEKRVKRLENMIETKEGCLKTVPNLALPHNNVKVLDNNVGAPLNPLFTQNGTRDAMETNISNRIGDKISLKGIKIKMFIENALGRAKVWYRFMVIKCAKGDTIDRSTLFKHDADNKMIDQINTERFTIVAQRVFNCQVSNAAVTGATFLTGEPNGPTAGQASKVVSLWIPGKKFGRKGNIQYEDEASQPKFFDYRLVFVAYDWFGTPQDTNNVGRVNELYCKLYFKDA